MAQDQDGEARYLPCHRLRQRPERRRRALSRQAENGELIYIGKLGTGWSRTMSSKIRKQLDTVVSPQSKLTKPIRKPKATWVEPSFAAEVEYRDITSEGLLRQSSFKGLTKID
jgi:bifunctional non-homologous end joining protein LigD